MKGKKVLRIDCDLRHGSTSQFVGMPSQGLSNYLIGTTDNWRSMLRPGKDLDGLAVMPIGHRPPNPSELLDNGRLGELLKEATPRIRLRVPRLSAGGHSCRHADNREIRGPHNLRDPRGSARKGRRT